MMKTLKTTPGRPSPSHPLSKGLAACWLLNEGSGAAALDASGRANHGTIELATWTTTPMGRGIHFVSPNQNIEALSCQNLPGSRGSVALWIKPDNVTVGTFCELSDGTSDNRVVFYMGAGALLYLYVKGGGSGANVWTKNTIPLNTTEVFHVAATWDASADDYHVYIDGVEVVPDATGAAGNPSGLDQVNLGTYNDGASAQFLGDMISACVYDRVLTASEIAWLYREPFAFLQPPTPCAPMTTAGVIHELSGSITAVSGLSALARVTRNVSGSIRAISSVSGALTVSSLNPEPVQGTVKPWRSAALFHGLDATACKLGTVLTGGAFWTRRAGCSAIFRGPSPAEVDFNDLLCVVGRDSQQIPLPTHLAHEPNSSYCYIARRFNGCGDLEQTSSAAVLVRIGADGKLAQAVPNEVVDLHASQITDRRVQLRWSYRSLDQQTSPEGFNIYWDGGAGVIDFSAPLAQAPYAGHPYHRFVSDSLAEGVYRFAVRAFGEDLSESMSLSTVSCPIRKDSPPTMTMLAAEANR